MSTLSGFVSKGEKGKQKYKSFDINNIYSLSRGESFEQHQQKNTLPRKHGMQSLGKVPSARRPPANLPSLKSEHSSSDPAVSLVPSGGSGWATTKDSSSTTSTTTTTTTTSSSSSDTVTTNSSPSVQCASGTTVSTSPALPGQQGTSQSSHTTDASNKSWSAIMSRSGDGTSPVNQQSGNREIGAQYGPGPSLRPQTEGSWVQGTSRTASGIGTGATGPGSGNTPEGQGPPLNMSGPGGHSDVPGGGRSNLGQSPGMGMGQVGPLGAPNNQSSVPPSHVGPSIHHFKGLIPSFMYRGNFSTGFPTQFPSSVGSNGPRPKFGYPMDRMPPPQRAAERERVVDDEIITRPIIKEEDLTRMDDISRDAGWAAHDDIDYNQKLAFSDDESEPEPVGKREPPKDKKEDKDDDAITEDKEKANKNDSENRDPKEQRDPQSHRPWIQSSSSLPRDLRSPNVSSGYSTQSHSLRGVGEDDSLNERLKKNAAEIAQAAERARQRKEEEEKKFLSTKQAAAKKLQDLEQRIMEKNAKHKDEERPAEPKSSITIPPVPIPLPDWERDRDNRERERSRTSSEGKDDKTASVTSATSREFREPRDSLKESRDSRDSMNDFRSNDRSNFLRQPADTPRMDRDRERERDRDQRDMRDREHPSSVRHFQNNLPPRFQKQQAERMGSNYNRVSPTTERPPPQSMSFSQHYDPGRWAHGHHSLSNNSKPMHMMPPSQRRTRADSDVSSSVDDDRPPSRDHRMGMSRDDRYRHSSHRTFDSRKSGYYDDYNRNYRDYDYDDRHSRDSWERERRFDDKERDLKDNLEPRENRDIRDSRDNRDTRDTRDNRDNRDNRENRENRDNRDIRENRGIREPRDRDIKDKKDYDSYMKDSFDDRDHAKERSSDSSEWREERNTQDRHNEGRREIPREERMERSERPQRPDSRDSRTSRESKTSSRDDDSHKTSRDCSSWINDIPDYEERKRDFYHEDSRERDRERDKERERRQPPGPVTKDKLEADEMKCEKRSLTQLKRASSDQDSKREVAKESSIETKQEPETWSRKTERALESNSRTIDRGGDNSPKAWADAVSPTFEKEEEVMLESSSNKDIKESVETKPNLEKNVDKVEDSFSEEPSQEPAKDEKREKNVRARTNSGSSSSRGRESRGGRQWGTYNINIYTRGWRGTESRGRRGGGHRSAARPASARSGSYGHTDSEISGDEISGSTESGKEDKRSSNRPSQPSSQKAEKDDRNREVSRREEGRGDAPPPQVRNEKRTYDNKPMREGFAPSGEPSRRGRGGGYRNRNPTSSNRMEGYGPPPRKNIFSSERNTDEKQIPSQHGSQSNSSAHEKESNTMPAQTVESNDDKIIAKQQALTAGITGRRNKSPNQQAQQVNNKQDNHANVPQKMPSKKDDSRSKRTRSGSRRGRDNRGRANSSNVPKPVPQDVGNEDWETTSENSEEHIEESKEPRNNRNKPFNQRGGQSSNMNSTGGNPMSRRNEQGGNRESREKNSKSSNASRNQGANDKRNLMGFGNQRNHPANIPPSMQNSQSQNGRPRSQNSTNNGSSGGTKSSNKDSTVNRMDEIKLTDPNLVNQALNDMNKKSQSKEKKMIDCESDSNNFVDDNLHLAEDQLDSDGFQEVRSKKNVKESRHNQKDEMKPAKREKEKDRERDRSKSKSNGSQPLLQQVQNIPPSLGQNAPQPVNVSQKQQYDRVPRPIIAPRFQRARLAKQQQQQQQVCPNESGEVYKVNSNSNYNKDSPSGPAPPPSVNAWDKPITGQLRSNSPSSVPADVQLMSGLTAQNDHNHDGNDQMNSGNSSQRNSPSGEKIVKSSKELLIEKNNVTDISSPPVQTLIFENTNYSKTTKTGPSDLAIKSKFSNHMKTQQRNIDKRGESEDDNSQIQHQQQALSAVFSNKPNDLIKEKVQESMQMPLSFNKNEDNADMKLDFTFDSDLSQLTDDKNKSLGMARSMHMSGGQSTISPSTAELNLKIASVKKVWENATPMPTVVEHEDNSAVSTASPFPQAFESNDVEDTYSSHQQYNQNNMKSEITTSTNVCKVKPQQQSSGSSGAQTGSAVPGPSPIGAGQSPIGHPPASLQGPLSPPPFNSTGQPSHINYQEFPQYPGSQAAQYGSMPTIPSPPAVLFNTGSGQLPTQAGGLYGAFQLDQSRSPFTQYPPYAPSIPNSFNQQNVYLQQPPPPPHAPNAPTPDMYQSNLSQYRITAAAAPPFGQNQQLSNNPNTVLINSSSNSLMSASVKPSSQQIGAIGTKAPHFQAPSAPQPNQLAYIPYDPNQVLGVSGSYMGSSQLVQRPGPNVQPSGNSYYSATSADLFPGSQTGFYQPGGATQQTGTPYGLQSFGQHNQNLATGNATPVGLQNFSSGFLSSSGLQITAAAAAAAQQYRNPTGGLPGNAAATFLNKHQPQEQPRQLKSPSGNQDVLASVFSSTPQIPSPKSRNCKQQSSSQQPQPSPTQHHKYPQYQGVSQSALVSSCNNYVLQQNVRGMGMPPRAGIQQSQPRYPPPIQRPVVPFAPGPNPQNPGQQPNCMPSQQQTQMNRHRSNLHQQQQQRNMKMQQQYYAPQANVKMDTNDKNDSHNDKISESNSANQSGNNKSTVNQQDGDGKEEVNQQNE